MGNLQADSTSVLRLTGEAKNEHGIKHVNAGNTNYENTKTNGAAQPEQLIEAVFISVGCSLTFHSMQHIQPPLTLNSYIHSTQITSGNFVSLPFSPATSQKSNYTVSPSYFCKLLPTRQVYQ